MHPVHLYLSHQNCEKPAIERSEKVKSSPNNFRANIVLIRFECNGKLFHLPDDHESFSSSDFDPMRRRFTEAPSRDPTHVKLAVIGDARVGKTSVVHRFLRGTFDAAYNPTLEQSWDTDIRVDPSDEGSVVLHFHIADTAGREDFRALRDATIADADMFLVVFSLAEMNTLNCAQDLIESIGSMRDRRRTSKGRPPFILDGNKADLSAERAISEADARKVARGHGGREMETSAQSGEGIPELFAALANLWVELHPSLKRKGTAVPDEDIEGGCCEVA
jgi:small GTP-binding protein